MEEGEQGTKRKGSKTRPKNKTPQSSGQVGNQLGFQHPPKEH
jgi:hypothetical protein